ncbi:MAG: helix-turn-helix domain-containing protein [Eubacteriales bacterium]
MEKLNDKEQLVYDFIADAARRGGVSPSVRDISGALGIKSTATVFSYINRLREKGYIEKDGSKSRALRLTVPASGSAADFIRVPYVDACAGGYFADAAALTSLENIAGYIDFPTGGRRYERSSLLAVTAPRDCPDVMIARGDRVVIEKNAADSAEVYLALEGGEVYFTRERRLAAVGAVVAVLRYS